MPKVLDITLRFQRAIETLRDPEASFTADTIYGLSDLEGDRLQTFNSLWPGLPVERRRDLISRLVETAETNFELDFSAIIYPALEDEDSEVRVTACEGVLEDSPRRVIERLMHMAQHDPFSEVRAAAVQSLGQFVLQGEFGKLPDPFNQRLQEMVLSLYRNLNEDLDVRRRALEAISNCGCEAVTDLIREAYYADDLPMRVSAVCAMGRSCDEVWAEPILDELSSEYPDMRYEAARAAGELELRPALPRLAELACEDDRQIQEIAIWALGEIGGKTSTKVLNKLASLADSTDDEELADAVAEAQAVASLVGEGLIPLFDFDEDDDDLLDDDDLVDLDDLDDFDDDDLDDLDDLDEDDDEF